MGLLSGASFDFDEQLPYYLQLKALLERAITTRALRPGEQLPSESEICLEFHVSRTVVRQALTELEYEGLVYKRKGKGTFVAEPKIVESFVQALAGFHEDITAQRRATRSIVLQLGLVAIDRRIAGLLGVRSNAKVVLLKRLRFVDDDPVQLVSSFIPHRLCPELLRADFTQQSLYGFLQSRGVFVARGYRTIEATQATVEAAKRMNLRKGDPMLRITSIGYTDDGTPVEYYEALHRGDRTRFRVELFRKHVGVHDKRSSNAKPGTIALSGIEVLPSRRIAAHARGRPAKRRASE